VTVEAGVPMSEVVEKTAPYGLLPLLGSSSHVGAVGYSLGGGAGWLVREYGLATDSIVAASLVTPDGELRFVDEVTEPDLFWGLKGGTDNFGVVTSLTLRLFPVESFYGGVLVFPVDRAREIFFAYRDWTRSLPSYASTSVSIAHIPPMPTVPPALQGQSVVIVRVGVIGSASSGEALMAPLRAAVGEPVFDSLGALPLVELDAIGMEPTDPLPVKGHVELVRELSDEALDALLAVAGPSAVVPYLQLELRHVGGGFRPAADRQGLGHWSGEFQLHAISVLASPELYAVVSQFNDALAAAMKPYVSGLVPLNFLEAEPERAASAYTEEHYRRLVALKKRYDPTNLFRLNNNIPPAGELG
jgi:FAD/FMN-containing dehydrogenase